MQRHAQGQRKIKRDTQRETQTHTEIAQMHRETYIETGTVTDRHKETQRDTQRYTETAQMHRDTHRDRHSDR